MTKHLGILVSPSGDEFYEAYGTMTTLRDRATRYGSAAVAIGSANHRYGRHQDAFWNSERASRDAALREYHGWTVRTEEVADDDEKRVGHYIVDYPSGDGGDRDRLYATRDGADAIGWSRDLGDCVLWPRREEAVAICRSLPKAEGRAFAVDSY
jgi:hypothetical protein